MTNTLTELLENHRLAVEMTDKAQSRQDDCCKAVEAALLGRRYRTNAGGGLGTYVISRISDHIRLKVYGRKVLKSGGTGSQTWDLGEFIPACLETVQTAGMSDGGKP